MRTRCSIRPSLETLETRDTPAGTVIATFAGGRLTLFGDAADNTLHIAQTADGRLILSADGSDTLIRLNKQDYRGAVMLPAPVTGKVTINLGDGADQLFVDGVTLPGSLSINGGNGIAGGPAGNKVYLRDIEIGGSLGLTNRVGADATYLWGGVNVHGALTIRNGAGGSNVWGDQSTDLRVGGVFSIIDGAGNDQVELWGAVSVALGGLAVNTGSDVDGSYLRVHPLGNLTVTGGVRVTNGPGNDFTDIGGQNVTIRGAVAIHNGDGGSFNTMLALGTLNVGQVVIGNGAGEDYNEIVTYDAAVVRGNVTFVNGDGVSTNYVGGGNALAVEGNVSFVNGAGRDLNTVNSTDARIGGAVAIRNADGGSDTSLGGQAVLLVQGRTRIAAGDGNDLVTIGAGRVLGSTPAVDVGAVRVDLGDGGSDTQIRGGRLAVHGPLSVTAWDGTDRVIVASESANGTVAGNVAIDLGSGDEQLVLLAAAPGRVLTVGGALGIWTDNPIGQNWIGLTALDVKSWTEIWTGAGSEEVRRVGLDIPRYIRPGHGGGGRHRVDRVGRSFDYLPRSGVVLHRGRKRPSVGAGRPNRGRMGGVRWCEHVGRRRRNGGRPIGRRQREPVLREGAGGERFRDGAVRRHLREAPAVGKESRRSSIFCAAYTLSSRRGTVHCR